jgi:hypothetical protein
MPSPFDGAGEPYRGSRFRGWLIVGIVCIVVIAIIWYAFSQALIVLPEGTNFGGEIPLGTTTP